MLASGHRQGGRLIMAEIRRGHHDRIEVLHFLVQQHAVVLIELGARPGFRRDALARGIDIAVSHDDVAGFFHAIEVLAAFAAGADDSQAQFVALVLRVQNIETKLTGEDDSGGGLEK